MERINEMSNIMNKQERERTRALQHYERQAKYRAEKKEMLEDIKNDNLQKLKYLNNEIKLYKYIKDNLNEDGLLVTSVRTVADTLKVNTATILRWEKLLVQFGVIESKSMFVNGKKQLILKIVGGKNDRS